VAAQEHRDVVIAGHPGPGGTVEDDAGAEGEGLGGGGGVDQLTQVLLFVGRQSEDRCFTRHGRYSLSQKRPRAREQGRQSASGGEMRTCTRTFILTQRF
jgi:hypothetical protein